MSPLLIIAEGSDPTVELLLEAANGFGVDVSLVDLRYDRFDLAVGPRAVVRVNGNSITTPTVVMNATSANSLGLAGDAALQRQRSSRWQQRHLAAKEEQGLLLAVLAHFRRDGAILVNPPEASDLALMPNARGRGLSASIGVPGAGVAQAALGLGLAGALLAGWPGLVAALATLFAATLVAGVAQARIGGQTGDILGAIEQASEMIAFVTLAAAAS